MRSRRFPLWTLLGVVLVVALLVGSGVFSSTPPTNAQRAASIESVIRCPSCEDLSVAVSSAPTAVTVRATVRELVDHGLTDRQIEDYLVARYGSTIVLDPPTSGWSSLVWVLPVAGGALAAVVLVVVLVRRRRRGEDSLDDDVLTGSADPVAVEERRRFLTQSLADADAEYLAGDLADADYLSLRQRDLARLAALGPSPAVPAVPGPALPVVARASDTASATATMERSDVPVETDGPERRRRGRNKWFLIGAIGCFVAALAVAVPLFSSDRLPGQTATGSVSLSPTQQVERTLDQAATVENQGQLGLAAQLYQQVLSAHPGNEVALAQLGWLEYRIGQQGSDATLLADARTKLTQAVAATPGDYAAHLYLGTLLLQLDGNATAAVTQFNQFLADSPPSAVVAQAATIVRQAYTAAGIAVPASVAA
jgi:cytochrome c-type biogenesis protein CcmH